MILVSSGAIAVGANAMGLSQKPATTSQKQALAAIGQARLMMTYQRLFAEYNQMTAQVLMTKYTVLNDKSRKNAQNTFEELLKMGVIPVVNENDTVATDEIEKVGTFGDNDHLSAIVAALVGADLLILLSDIDGMYTDDPSRNPEAHFIPLVREITDESENGKRDFRKQCGNRRYGSKSGCCQNCNGFWCGSCHWKRGAGGEYSLHYGGKRGGNAVFVPKERDVSTDGLY